MSIDIICPLYNAEKYIDNLHKSFLMQENVDLNKIRYILTESNDNTEKYLKDNKIKYTKIKKEEFSHSLSRENEAYKSKADILVFVTQDVVIERKDWLHNLTKDIESGKCEAAYSRQISKSNGIEKYTREKNYPEKSSIVSKKDVDKLELRTFFFSDASSAIKKDIFLELEGYNHKKLPISEDMYIAYKLIMAGYRIKYCANSVVIHSHTFSFKAMYKRYYDTGVFFKENSYLNQYGTNKTGGGMAKYVLKRSFQDRNGKALVKFIPDMAARYIGMKAGKR